jgi:hypothetical protein
MTEDEIRNRVLMALADALLPRELPRLEPGQSRQMLMEAGAALNDRCVICDEIATHIRYNLAEGRLAFHQRCHDVWKEEAFKAVHRQNVAKPNAPSA